MNFCQLTIREMVFLKYTEIMPEDRFAISCFVSLDRPDIPVTKGHVRVDSFGGYIVRGDPQHPDKCRLTIVVHSAGNVS